MMLNIKNKSKKTTGVCPFCFAHFKIDTAPFRCTAVPQVCAPQIDEAYSTYWNHTDKQPMGRVFLPSQNRKWKWKKADQPICDICATNTNLQICPECHNSLDPHFQEAAEYTVVLLVDKTEEAEAYIAHVQEKMRQIVAHDLGFMVHLYAERPFDIHLERLDKKTPKRLHLHFYPLSVDEIGSSNPWYRKLMDHTQGILILSAGQNLNPPSSNLEMTLEKLCTESISIPTALVLTGLEHMVPFLSPQSHILHNPNHIKGVDVENILRASNESMGYLGSWGYINVLHLMRKNWPYRIASFVSKNLRVEDPILWLLYQWNCLTRPASKDH